jgi:hypothetical protein
MATETLSTVAGNDILRLATYALNNAEGGGLPVLIPIPFSQTFAIPVAVPTTINDTYVFFTFPSNASLVDFRGTPGQFDTNGAPAVTYDIIATDQADATKFTIVSASTKGRTGTGTDRMQDSAMGKFCGNMKLKIKFTAAAATPAAANYAMVVVFRLGTVTQVAGGGLLTDHGV